MLRRRWEAAIGHRGAERLAPRIIRNAPASLDVGLLRSGRFPSTMRWSRQAPMAVTVQQLTEDPSTL
jgi:hypothetical protein